MSTYQEFIAQKSQIKRGFGFEPIEVPDFLFDFQKSLVEWSIRMGRSAIFADCGLGKTPMQLVWADNVFRHTGKPVLIMTPLAVARQTIKEANKFGIDACHSQDGSYSGGIVVANYERLHHFNSDDFSGVVCDESSILKNCVGTRRKQITRFMSKIHFRLLCTATAAPNDYVELGTSSEALGELSNSDMLRRFFRQFDEKGQKSERKQQQDAEALLEIDPNYFQKLSYRVAQTIGQWRLKHHAIEHFWRWVTSWSRACRMPSDLGFNDGEFLLPELTESDHIIDVPPAPGMLFATPAKGMGDERAERRRTMKERCEFAAELVDHDRPAVIWCHMNDEGDMLEKIIPDAKQIAGKTPDDRKCDLYDAFSDGDLRVLVIKPKIGAWGLNWQHCNHVVEFVTHSYEQHYQGLRRCLRFGQTRPVHNDVIATEGEARVIGNLRRKARQADQMFEILVKEMNRSMRVERQNEYTNTIEVPTWL